MYMDRFWALTLTLTDQTILKWQHWEQVIPETTLTALYAAIYNAKPLNLTRENG